MKKFKYLFITLFFMVIFIGTANAENYVSHNMYTTISTDGFSKDNEVSFETYKSIDMRFNRNIPYSLAYFNVMGDGVVIEKNANAFTFPFAITDITHNSQKMTCNSYFEVGSSYTLSYQTLYKDGSTSQNDGVINENMTHPQFCNNFNINNNNDYSINIGYKLSDNTKYNCLVTETGSSNVALCPITNNRTDGNFRITQIYFVFTRINTDSETKIRVTFPTNIMNQINLQQSILDTLNDLNSKINQSNNIQSQIQNNTNQIKNDIKSTNTSGGESAADDLKNNSAFQDNSGLSSVVSMPLTFVNSLSNTCQPISLNIPYFDVDMQIPCLQAIITDKMPTLANILKVVINGFIIYRVLLDIFQIIRNAKNPEDDRIEVLDL